MQKDSDFNFKNTENKAFNPKNFQKTEEFASGGSDDNYDDDFEIGESI